MLCLYSFTSHSATIAPAIIVNNLNNSRVLQHNFAPMSVKENIYSKLVVITRLNESFACMLTPKLGVKKRNLFNKFWWFPS